MRLFRRLIFAGVAAVTVPAVLGLLSLGIASRVNGAKDSGELLHNAQRDLQTIRSCYEAAGRGQLPEASASEGPAPASPLQVNPAAPRKSHYAQRRAERIAAREQRP